MRFFKIIEVSEDTYLENVGNYDYDCLYEVSPANARGAVYASVNDDETSSFELDLEQFDEE